MIQGGDPTGTGKGGTSIWGKKFNDEIRESLKVIKSGFYVLLIRFENIWYTRLHTSGEP